MTEEKQIVLNKIDTLLNKRKAELLKKLPSIHEIDDGIIIRFFTEWDECHNDIKFKRIIDDSKPEEVILFYFLPKGAVIERKKRDYIKCIACLSGELEIIEEGETRYLTSYKKFCLETDEFQGVALEDTYVITSNR